MSEIEGYLEKNPQPTRAVVGYLVTADGREVILGLRKEVSNDLGLNVIAGIGGKVEDETDEEALRREVLEEIGVVVKECHKVAEVIFLFPGKPKWNQFVVAYLVTDWKGVPDEKEKIQPDRYPIDNLPVKQMWDDNQYWVPRVLAGEQLQAVFVYGEDNKTVEDMKIEESHFS